MLKLFIHCGLTCFATILFAQPSAIQWINYGLAGLESVAVSANGKYLVTSATGKYGLKVWDIAMGTLVHGDDRGVDQVAISPDGRIISATYEYRSSCTYETRTFYYFFSGSEFGPDSMRVVSGLQYVVASSPSTYVYSDRNGFHVADIITGTIIADLEGYFQSMEFSEDGSLLLGYTDTSVTVITPPLYLPQRTFPVTSARAFSLSPDKIHLAVGTENGVNIYQTNDGALIAIFSEITNVRDVEYVEEGASIVATGSPVGQVLFFDAYNGARQRTLHCSDTAVTILGYNDESDVLITRSRNVISVWNTEGFLYCIGSERNWIHSVAFSPNGELVAMSDWSGLVQLYSKATGTLIRTIPTRASGWYGTCHENIKFSPDSKNLIVATPDGRVEDWNIASVTSRSFVGTDSIILALSIREDGKYLSVLYSNDSLVVWDYVTGEVSISRGVPGGSGEHPAFSRNGSYLAAGPSLYTSRGALLRSSWFGEPWSNTNTAVGNDGKYVVAYPNYWGDPLRLINSETGQGTDMYELYGDYQRGPLAFSEWGTYFIEAIEPILVWNAANRSIAFDFDNEHFVAAASALSPGDSLLFVGCDDGTVFLMNLGGVLSETSKVTEVGSRDDLLVYPNPVNDFATIVLPNDMHCEVTLYDLSGRNIQSFTDYSVSNGKKYFYCDFRDIPLGVYTLRSSASQPLVHRIIVAR